MLRHISRIIWISTLLVLSCGLITLYSASYQNVRVSHDVFYDQLFCILFGLVIMYLLSRTDYRRFYDLALGAYLLSTFLLLAVLLGGRHALGAQRWIEVGGLSFQPSEIMKLTLILMLARYLSNRRPTLSFSFRSRTQTLIRDLIIPFLIAIIPIFLVFKQPDLGTAILLFGIFFMMIFVSGLEMRYILGFAMLCLIAVPFGWGHLKDYQKDRLLVFLNPNIDPLGAGYTIIQSKIAIGSGALWGKGWLAGTQSQLNFLPERHTDFIFAVIAEEWGFLGCLIVISFYATLIFASLKVAEYIKDPFGSFVCMGIVTILTLQVIINIGMVMGLFPIVGITLPMISYGRTSLLIFMIMIGFLLSLSKKPANF